MKFSGPKPISAQYKVYAAAVAWLILCAVMFTYGFGILDASNSKTVLEIAEQKSSLTTLENERNSFIKAKQDIAQMESQALQPKDLFSRDVTLIKEIQTLEGWADQLGLTLNLTGVSGTIKTAPKAKTLTDIYTLPYSINVAGPYTQAVKFLEVLEHLSFITNISALSVSAGSGNAVSITLNASFYLKK